jgi:hypothetical protein
MSDDLSSMFTPVHFSLSMPEHGWVFMQVEAGSASWSTVCSSVFDPFPELVDLLARAAGDSISGTVCIDEEGIESWVRLDVEPGKATGRLRVFRPGEHGSVETAGIDCAVDLRQLAHAWLQAFVPMVEGHDAAHWITWAQGPHRRMLSAIDVRWLQECADGWTA